MAPWKAPLRYWSVSQFIERGSTVTRSFLAVMKKLRHVELGKFIGGAENADFQLIIGSMIDFFMIPFNHIYATFY